MDNQCPKFTFFYHDEKRFTVYKDIFSRNEKSTKNWKPRFTQEEIYRKSGMQTITKGKTTWI